MEDEKRASLERRARIVSRASKTAGTGAQATGKTMKVAGTGAKYAGKVVSTTGKGINNVGQGINKVGASLNSTGPGAILGIPLNVLGTTVSAAGKGVDAAGKAIEKTGDATKKAGDIVDKAGKKVKQTGKEIKKINKLGILDKANKLTKSFESLKKYKYLIIFGGLAILIIMLFMFLIMAMEAMGILDAEDSGNGGSASSYSDLMANVNGSNNEELWWPIGSEDITSSIELDGATLEFRSGEPVKTNESSPYGYRGDDEDAVFHSGIDIYESGDIYLIAMGDGVITYISPIRDSGYYNTQPTPPAYTCDDYGGMIVIEIEYNSGHKSRYLHLKEKSIPDYLQEGDKVYQGQVVGMMGNTGCSSGQHLHFEIYVNNATVNPANYVSESNPRPMASGAISTSEEILKNSTSNPTGTPGTGQFVEGTSNQQTVCLTLKSYYSNNVVAGLMVNIEKESSFDPTNEYEEKDGSISVGLFQWRLDRLTGLKSRHGDNWTSIANQIEYFQYEISTSESSTAPILADTTSSASEIAYDFCETFERAEDCSPRADESLANKYLTYVNNGCK